MKKVSSKFLNLRSLAAVTETLDSSDSVILLTNFGHIIGELYFNESEEDLTVSDLIIKGKTILLDKMESDTIGDGSMICVKNAIVKYSNSMTFNFNEITVHCDDIVGFSPINRDSYLNQLDQSQY